MSDLTDIRIVNEHDAVVHPGERHTQASEAPPRICGDGVSADQPQPPVLSSGATRDDLSDKDGRIISNMRVIGSSSNTETQTRVPLEHTHTHTRHSFGWRAADIFNRSTGGDRQGSPETRGFLTRVSVNHEHHAHLWVWAWRTRVARVFELDFGCS